MFLSFDIFISPFFSVYFPAVITFGCTLPKNYFNGLSCLTLMVSSCPQSKVGYKILGKAQKGTDFGNINMSRSPHCYKKYPITNSEFPLIFFLTNQTFLKKTATNKICSDYLKIMVWEFVNHVASSSMILE